MRTTGVFIGTSKEMSDISFAWSTHFIGGDMFFLGFFFFFFFQEMGDRASAGIYTYAWPPC